MIINYITSARSTFGFPYYNTHISNGVNNCNIIFFYQNKLRFTTRETVGRPRRLHKLKVN